MSRADGVMVVTSPLAKTASTLARASFTWPSTTFTTTFESLPRVCACRSRTLMACGPSNASVGSVPSFSFSFSFSFCVAGQNPFCSTVISKPDVPGGTSSSITPTCSVVVSGSFAPRSKEVTTVFAACGA